jgi:hypothetical protein
MKDPNWTVIGFIEVFIFPVTALWLAVVTATDPAISVVVVELIYPLGLLGLVLFGILLVSSKQNYPQSYVAFCNGARYAVAGVFVVSFPVLVITAFLLHQTTIAASLLAIGIGAIWLPSASAAGAYASALGGYINREDFFSKARMRPYNSEKFVMVFLSLFLGEYRTIAKFYEAGLFVVFDAGLYVFGWSVLNSLRIYPAIIFDLAFILVTPLVGYLLFRQGTSDETRKALRKMLEDYRR